MISKLIRRDCLIATFQLKVVITILVEHVGLSCRLRRKTLLFNRTLHWKDARRQVNHKNPSKINVTDTQRKKLVMSQFLSF